MRACRPVNFLPMSLLANPEPKSYQALVRDLLIKMCSRSVFGMWRRRAGSNRCIAVLQTAPLATWVRRPAGNGIISVDKGGRLERIQALCQQCEPCRLLRLIRGSGFIGKDGDLFAAGRVGTRQGFPPFIGRGCSGFTARLGFLFLCGLFPLVNTRVPNLCP